MKVGGGQGRQSRGRREGLRASITRASPPWDLSCLLSDLPMNQVPIQKSACLTTCQSLPRVSSFPGSHGLSLLGPKQMGQA